MVFDTYQHIHMTAIVSRHDIQSGNLITDSGIIRSCPFLHINTLLGGLSRHAAVGSLKFCAAREKNQFAILILSLGRKMNLPLVQSMVKAMKGRFS